MFITFSDAKLLAKLSDKKTELEDEIVDAKKDVAFIEAQKEGLSYDRTSKAFRAKKAELTEAKNKLNALNSELLDIITQINMDSIDAIKKVDQETGKIKWVSTKKQKETKKGLFGKKSSEPVQVPTDTVEEIEAASEEELKKFLSDLDDDFSDAALNKAAIEAKKKEALAKKEQKEKQEEKAFRNATYYIVNAEDGVISLDGGITRKPDEMQLYKNESAARQAAKFYEKQYEDVDVTALPTNLNKKITKEQVDDSEIDLIENKKRNQRLAAEQEAKELAKEAKEKKKAREEFLSKRYWGLDIKTDNEEGLYADVDKDEEEYLTEEFANIKFFESREAVKAFARFIKNGDSKYAGASFSPYPIPKEFNEELSPEALDKLSSRKFRMDPDRKRFRNAERIASGNRRSTKSSISNDENIEKHKSNSKLQIYDID